MSRAHPLLDRRSRAWTLLAAAACLLPLLLQLPGTIALAIAGVGLLVAVVSWRHPAPAWLRC